MGSAEAHTDPTRLRQPARRAGTGANAHWQPIGWPEAFDLVADELADAINASGRDAVGIYQADASGRSVGMLTHGRQLVRLIRSHNTFSPDGGDLPLRLVSLLMYGHQFLTPTPDIDHTDYVLAFGADLTSAPTFPAQLRALHARHGRLVVIDPHRSQTAAQADEHVVIRPGTDAWLLLAMLNEMLRVVRGQTFPHVRGLAEADAAVAAFTAEHAEAVSGVPAETIRRLTREFAAANAAVTLGGNGVSAHEVGSICHWAIQLLNIVTGNLDRPGGALFTASSTSAPDPRSLLGSGHVGKWTSRVGGLLEFSGELPAAALREEIETPGYGQIRALLTIDSNPALTTPDAASLELALGSLDFVATIGGSLNETTRHADVILPPATTADKAPEERYEWQILGAIGRRLLRRLDRRPGLWARLVIRTRLTLSPSSVLRLLRLRSLGRNQFGHRPPDIDLAPALVLHDLQHLWSSERAMPGTP